VPPDAFTSRAAEPLLDAAGVVAGELATWDPEPETFTGALFESIAESGATPPPGAIKLGAATRT
jgi:hypothetical protein